jgi:hypothetical protein
MRWTGPLDILKWRCGDLVMERMKFDIGLKFRIVILTWRYNPDI